MTSETTWEDRFWAKVDVRGEDECWVWTASTAGGGYGQFGVRHGKTAPAHRIAWELTNGPIPDGKWILHHCDNRPCCNPKHLYAGTRQENVDDMMRRGRHWSSRGDFEMTRGENNGRAKLTEAQVREIRERRAAGERIVALAQAYGITHPMVSQIALRQAWRHVQ